jgi:hypothetical protein
MLSRSKKPNMQIRIEFLGAAARLEEALRSDGWQLSGAGPGGVIASHAEVPDEATARQRLDRLGLLTSPLLRVEFPLAPGDP